MKNIAGTTKWYRNSNPSNGYDVYADGCDVYEVPLAQPWKT